MENARQPAAQQARVLKKTEPKHRGELSRTWRRLRRHRLGVASLVFILALCVMAIAAPILAPHNPYALDTSRMGEGPSWSHPFGFDEVGRDILSRTIYGARVTMIIALVSTAISIVIGTAVGATAGYFGGWINSALSRLIDTLMAFPILILLLTLSAVLGPSVRNVTIILGVTLWATYARVVRAEVLSLRERDFVLAARGAGATSARIIFRHIVPNTLGPVIVIATLGIGVVIIIAAALSFLGLGVQQPTASWGSDLSTARVHMQFSPHIAIVPGVMITVTVLAFNMLGDALRDALDPREKD
jgi:peptide/nickel transport system permease protein